MCTNIACIGDGGCTAAMPPGTEGQILTQGASAAQWSNGDNVAITPISGITATELREILQEVHRPNVAAMARSNYGNLARPTVTAGQFVPMTFSTLVANTFHETVPGMIQPTHLVPTVTGYYDIFAYIDFPDIVSGARVGLRITATGPSAEQVHMGTTSTARRVRVDGAELGLFLFANQPVRLHAWTESQTTEVIDSKLAIRLIQQA